MFPVVKLSCSFDICNKQLFPERAHLLNEIHRSTQAIDGCLKQGNSLFVINIKSSLEEFKKETFQLTHSDLDQQNVCLKLTSPNQLHCCGSTEISFCDLIFEIDLVSLSET